MKPAPINPHVALLKVVLSGRDDVDAVIAGMVRRRVARRAFAKQVQAWRHKPLREFQRRLLVGFGLPAEMIESMIG